MIELKLNEEKLKDLLLSGYDLNIVFLLKMVEKGGGIDEFCSSIPKLQSLLQTLQRKQLISDGKLTLEGEELLKFFSSKSSKTKMVKSKPSEDKFTLWWTAFPSSDTFDYKGRHFPGTRSLKAKKDDCKIKLNKILNEGQYTIEELVKAIELEVHQKKENSIKTGKNKLSFFQNSMNYLNQYTYESYVELVRKGTKVKEELVNTGGTDI